jgi:hypothetical protein
MIIEVLGETVVLRRKPNHHSTLIFVDSFLATPTIFPEIEQGSAWIFKRFLMPKQDALKLSHWLEISDDYNKRGLRPFYHHNLFHKAAKRFA